jgi:hypothetical protein
LCGISGLLAVHALLRQDRVRQGRVLVDIGLRVDSATQIQMTTTTDSHTAAAATTTTSIGSVYPSSIGEDVSESAFCAELAVALVRGETNPVSTRAD